MGLTRRPSTTLNRKSKQKSSNPSTVLLGMLIGAAIGLIELLIINEILGGKLLFLNLFLFPATGSIFGGLASKCASRVIAQWASMCLASVAALLGAPIPYLLLFFILPISLSHFYP